MGGWKTKKTAPKGGLRRSKHAGIRGLGAVSSLGPSLACRRLSGCHGANDFVRVDKTWSASPKLSSTLMSGSSRKKKAFRARLAPASRATIWLARPPDQGAV